jgi:hypothetical protein
MFMIATTLNSYRSSRAHGQGFQAKTPNSQQRGTGGIEEFLHHQ